MKRKTDRPSSKAVPRKGSRAAEPRERSAGPYRPAKPAEDYKRPKSSEARASEPRTKEPRQTEQVTQREPALPPRPLTIRTGEKPAERVPIILETLGEPDYRLIDSGDGAKFERYGAVTMIRPEAQALWPKSLAEAEWAKADAVFTGDTDEEGMGRWRFPHRLLGETWPMRLLETDFLGRFTSFRHVGVFPEQIAHWAWMKERILAARSQSANPLKVLNLFGYTGVASLIAAGSGAEVTHVDASKKAIGWARENLALAGLQDKPIRWICEDAMKFIQREERRGSRYDIILTDPPRFGRGPNGEIWELYDHVALMLDICRELLSPDAQGLVLTAYSIRSSFYSIHEVMREIMRGRGGTVESGELIIRETGLEGRDRGRALSTSLFSRWVPK